MTQEEYNGLFEQFVSIKRNPFRLSSGRESRLYINLRGLTTNTTDIEVIAEGLIDLAREEGVEFDTFIGVAEGCTPLGIITSYILADDKDREVPLIMKRGSVKKYGDRKDSLFIGSPEGKKVILIEDVTTTGKSIVSDLADLRKIGADVKAVVTLVDRLEKTPIPGVDDPALVRDFAENLEIISGRRDYAQAGSVSEILHNVGVPFYSLTTAHSLLRRMARNIYPELKEELRREYVQFGASPLILE